MTGEDWTDSGITGTDLGSSAVIASTLTAVKSSQVKSPLFI